MGPSARIWKIILDEKKSDREMINSWKGSNRWVLISVRTSVVHYFDSAAQSGC